MVENLQEAQDAWRETSRQYAVIVEYTIVKKSQGAYPIVTMQR
jgi:hypothetical protein